MKKLTMAKRREVFFATVESFRAYADKHGFIQGCRAANPAKHDNDETRKREDVVHNYMYQVQGTIAKQFNAAIRAAKKEARA